MEGRTAIPPRRRTTATERGERARGGLGGLGLGLLCASLLACAPGRIADLRDVAQLSVHGGLGFSADARLGVLTQPAIGLWSTSFGLGNHSREASGLFFHKRISPPYAASYFREEGRSLLSALNSTGWDAFYQLEPGAFQRAFEEVDRPLSPRPPREFGREIDGVVYGGEVREGAWLPFPDSSREAPIARSLMDWTQLDGGAQFGIVGGRIGANPLELVDFLLGFVGLDIAGDDGPPNAQGDESEEGAEE